MIERLKKVKLKANESFNFREGWLRKGMRCVSDCSTLFSQDDVMERLGVGSKMVKSIRFWLQATALCEEQYASGGRGKEQVITEYFGQVIAEFDPYFEDMFTLFLLHYHIVSNENLCMVWNIFFNEYRGEDFTRESMEEICSDLLTRKMESGATFSEKLFNDDCYSVIKMYLNTVTAEDPEESLACPLSELGLIQKSSKVKNSFIKKAPNREILDNLVILYVIVDNLKEGKNSVGIDDLLNAPNNIGRVFNLNRVLINEYLDQLRISGYITINRTAGLDMIYVETNMTPKDIMIEYYTKAQVQ